MKLNTLLGCSFALCLMSLYGCVEEGGSGDNGPVDQGPTVDTSSTSSDGTTVEDGSSLGDDARLSDMGVEPDGDLPDARAADATVVTIDSCQSACARHESCGRLDVFGSTDACLAECARSSRDSLPDTNLALTAGGEANTL